MVGKGRPAEPSRLAAGENFAFDEPPWTLVSGGFVFEGGMGTSAVFVQLHDRAEFGS
jgi:hypothetical protein